MASGFSATLYWVPAVLLMAAGQGLCMPAIRRTPPGPEARRQAVALHYLLAAAYFLPLVLAPATWPAAVLARALLFDLVLNVAAGEPAFAVGQTAASDRAVRKLAKAVGWPPELVRALLLVPVAAVGLWWLLHK